MHGHITLKASSKRLPSRTRPNTYTRDMDTTNALITTDDDFVRFHKLKLEIIKSGHRTVVHHDSPGK